MYPFKFIMVTKANCPNCDHLKSFLKEGLKNRYASSIFIVDESDDKEAYDAIVRSQALMSVPAMIHIESNEKVVGFNPAKVKALLEKEF